MKRSMRGSEPREVNEARFIQGNELSSEIQSEEK